jgi:hypothetical protein
MVLYNHYTVWLEYEKQVQTKEIIMLAQQKEATFTLISSIVFALLLLFVSPLFTGARSEVILILFALFILSLWIVRQSTGLKFKNLDEMDKTIRLQAAIIAVHGFGATVAIYAFSLYLIHRTVSLVPIHQVLSLAFIGWLSLYFVWTLAILILYRRGALHV